MMHLMKCRVTNLTLWSNDDVIETMLYLGAARGVAVSGGNKFLGN